jgi:heme/copper-type cytochrome/quinol oxidase subunit 2
VEENGLGALAPASFVKGTAASRLKWIWIAVMVILTIVITVLIYFAFLFISHGGNRNFLSIDSCLDGGSRWNYETWTCEGR